MRGSNPCINDTGYSCTADNCECYGIKPKPMESLEDIKKYEKGVILDILQQGTIKRGALLNKIHFGISDRRMRDFIAELIKDGECIQSSNEGYTLITSQEQLYEAVGYLNKKVVALARRKNTLISNYNRNREPGQQITLEL